MLVSPIGSSPTAGPSAFHSPKSSASGLPPLSLNSRVSLSEHYGLLSDTRIYLTSLDAANFLLGNQSPNAKPAQRKIVEFNQQVHDALPVLPAAQ